MFFNGFLDFARPIGAYGAAPDRESTVDKPHPFIHADTGGYYMDPAIVTRVAPHHRLFRNEVFGPVLAVTPFSTEQEALHLANATDYGLAAGVWTGNLGRAHRMLRGIRAGVVHVNTYGGADITEPLSGTRQSGNGADKSLHALDKYTDLKTGWIQL